LKRKTDEREKLRGYLQCDGIWGFNKCTGEMGWKSVEKGGNGRRNKKEWKIYPNLMDLRDNEMEDQPGRYKRIVVEIEDRKDENDG
jgi:hypothetical protein